MRTWRWALALSVLLAGGGCRGELQLEERPLLDGRHEPDVLVEAAALEPPPAVAGNRFVSGWLPLSAKGGFQGLVPTPGGARLELVNLERRPRTLVLLATVAAPAGAEVTVRFRERELDRQPVSERIRIRLPGDLPLGRVPIDLAFSDADSIAVQRAKLRPSLTAGEASFRDGSIVQSPWSAIDLVQELPPGSVLLGGFQPPSARGPEQQFAISVETADGDLDRVFEWTGQGAQEIRVELPDSRGPTRVRLEATGRGGAGRWDDLRVAEAVRPRRPVSAPPAPRLVILYVFDALRADYVGHLGGPEGVSPTLDRLAAEGVTFTDHISVAPNTKPSVKSLFIGQPFFVRGHERLPDGGPPTLAESFVEAGYRTISVSASPWVSSSFGTDRGFEHRSAKAGYRPKGRSGARYNDSAERVHAAALEWIESLAADDRAFFYLHTMHPHNPYDPPAAFEERFAGGIDSTIDGSTRTLLSIKQGQVATTAADRERLRALYTAGLAYNDAELAGFMAALDQRFERGEVLVVFTSDHGEELFEHGGVLHGYTLYEEQLHIPLVFWWPGVLEPRRIEVGTDHLDLAATFQSLAGQPFDDQAGLPLWSLMTGDTGEWPKRMRFAAASSVAGGIFLARAADLKLVWAPRAGGAWGMGQGIGRSYDAEYLFDLAADPGEHENLAALGGLGAELLRARLAAWVERGMLTEIGSDGEEQVDEETLERLRALGYVD